METLTTAAKGVFVIAVTPFTESGAIDEASIDSMVDFYLDKGVDGLTLLGMMGEAQKLTLPESIFVVRRALTRARGKPVVVGVSAPGLAAIGELTRAVMDAGAAGVMVAPTSGLRTDDQIADYYRDVAGIIGSGVPIVIQDYPLGTGVTIAAKTLRRIVDSIPEVVMVKHEDWPGLEKISSLRAAEARGGRRVSILCGNGGLFLPEEMERGADGAMTGFAFPEMMIDVYRLCANREFERARDIFDAYLPLVRYEQQPGLGLAVRKHVLTRRGAIANAAQRKPGRALSPAALTEVERLLARQASRLEALTR